MSRPALRWIADASGEAHAHRPGDRLTLCGRPRIDERYAWPHTSRCSECTAIVEDRRGS